MPESSHEREDDVHLGESGFGAVGHPPEPASVSPGKIGVAPPRPSVGLNFRMRRHSAAEVSRRPLDRFASLRFPQDRVDSYALLR